MTDLAMLTSCVYVAFYAASYGSKWYLSYTGPGPMVTLWHHLGPTYLLYHLCSPCSTQYYYDLLHRPTVHLLWRCGLTVILYFTKYPLHGLTGTHQLAMTYDLHSTPLQIVPPSTQTVLELTKVWVWARIQFGRYPHSNHIPQLELLSYFG